jgi:hypothetical protein
VIVYRSLLSCHLLPTFGDTPIAKVTPSLVRTWHAALLAEKLGSGTAAYRLLRAVVSTAVHDGLLPRSPCGLDFDAARCSLFDGEMWTSCVRWFAWSEDR